MHAAVTSAADRGLRFGAIGLGLAIPVSVAIDNLLLAGIALLWLVGGRYRDKLCAIRDNPVAMAALCLFAVLAIATAWSPAPASGNSHYLAKYVDLLFIGLFAWAFADPRVRRIAIHAFGVAILLSLLVSLLLATRVIPETPLLAGTYKYPSAFKLYLTHNILMAFGAFAFANLAMCATSPLHRRLHGALAALAAFDVLFLVHGRTGQLILLALMLYGFVALRGWRGVLMAAVAAIVLCTAAYHGSSSFRGRLDRAASEFAAWRPDVAAAKMSSFGLRMEFYRNSLELMGDRPMLGHGTGAFPIAYADKVKGRGMIVPSNPHNEYLMIGVQAGAAGLACFVGLLVVLWRHARTLAPPECHLARGLVITFAMGSLLNCLLLDHTEGLLFAWMAALVSGARVAPEPA
jgi:O-antigen ligase